jgi:hypothetical protein
MEHVCLMNVSAEMRELVVEYIAALLVFLKLLDQHISINVRVNKKDLEVQFKHTLLLEDKLLLIIHAYLNSVMLIEEVLCIYILKEDKYYLIMDVNLNNALLNKEEHYMLI